MALKCYPLQPGGLIAIESVIMGLTDTKQIYYEVDANLKVILLLVVIVSIYFMKDFLLFIFTKLVINAKNKRTLSLLFVFSAAFYRFFRCINCHGGIDCCGCRFYHVYKNVAEKDGFPKTQLILQYLRVFLGSSYAWCRWHGFRRFQIVGEPQNLLIASVADWSFVEFFIKMLPISFPYLFVVY